MRAELMRVEKLLRKKARDRLPTLLKYCEIQMRTKHTMLSHLLKFLVLMSEIFMMFIFKKHL